MAKMTADTIVKVRMPNGDIVDAGVKEIDPSRDFYAAATGEKYWPHLDGYNVSTGGYDVEIGYVWTAEALAA